MVQGITGRDGSFHSKQMLEYGTAVVAGVTPGKGGQKFEEKVPIFNTVADAVQATGANTSVIYVPPGLAGGAIAEAADAGVTLVVCITEGIPVVDMMRVIPFVREKGVRLLGPNCPGLISPGQAKVGIIPGSICLPGNVGLVSRSGTLTYEVVNHLTKAGIGQTTCVGIGGDPIIGTNFIDTLAAFQADPGYARGRHDGRDRRDRRAEGRGVREGEPDQAGGGIHRGPDRAAGPQDGARGRDHLGFVGNRGGEDGRVQGQRDRGDGAAGGCGEAG